MARKKKVYPGIEITGIADKGLAVGRDKEGVVYFVEGAVPGDIVDVLVLRKKKSFRKGIVHQFIKYSDERVEAFCEHFGNCGGCKWQYLNYESQLKYKNQSVLDAFQRLANLEIKEIRPILGCAQTQYYRNKMEYTFSNRRWVPQIELDTQEEVSFGPAAGFHKGGSFDKVVQIKQCHLQDDISNQIRNYVHETALEKEWTYYHAREHHGFLRNLRVRNSTLGDWMIVMIFGEDQTEDIQFLLEGLKSNFDMLSSIYYVVNTKKNDTINDLDLIHYHGEETITERLKHIEYKVGPKSFFQTNTKQAELLYNEIVKISSVNKTDVVYDLYTGLGSIALYIADKCQKVIGIEEIKEAIDDAKYNQELNKIDNADFEVGDVKMLFNDVFVSQHGPADLIIVDPPRPGLHGDVVNMLIKTGVDKILYVSCNPSTQARDIGLMAEHYVVEVIQPVDMFPHTHHIENIALLKRK